MDELNKFLHEADRLILKHIAELRIKPTRIRQLENHRATIEKQPEPYRSLALKYLDELVEFAHVLNDKGGEAAEPYGQKAMKTLDEIADELDRYAAELERINKLLEAVGTNGFSR